MAQLNEDQPGESLRDALDAAFEEHGADDSGADAPAPAPAAPAPAPTDPAAPTPAPAPAEGDEGRVRDASGRFAPKQGAPVATAPGIQQPTNPLHTPAPGPSELKPPASWTPQAREKWAALDPDIRAEVHRREGEAQRVLQQSAQHRQFVESFENVVRPFEVFIRTEGANPLQAVHNLMSTAAEFRVGTPQRKVELVAGIIKNFGIDIAALDSALVGVIGGQGAATGGQQEFRDPRLDQFLAERQREQQAAQQRTQQEVAQQMQAFAASHEFFGDVRDVMADLLELAAKRGDVLDPEKAYSQACKLHEGVSTILQQRAANPAKVGNSQAVLRAKRAASSVKGDPTPHDGALVPKDDSVRAAIEAALNSQSA
jgi:hypothetical protein